MRSSEHLATWTDDENADARTMACPVATAHAPMTCGLQPGEFRCIAKSGFDDPCNAYPHSLAWFRDHLYVGTTRCVLMFLHYRSPDLQQWENYPVRPAESNPYTEFDSRAQVWRYHPPSQHWEKMLSAEMITTEKGGQVPTFHGVRTMTIFRGAGEDQPALYCSTWAPPGGPGATLLRSVDGVHFDQLSLLGIEPGLYSSFRALIEYKGKLYTAPASKAGSRNAAGVAMVLESADPMRDPWHQVNVDSFGDAYNESIAEMAVFNGFLYVGTRNVNGFQVWKTDAEGPPPFRWMRVLARGAGRGPTNQTAGSLQVFGDALYIGTAIGNGGYDRTHGVGPAAFELVRVYEDDSWDLVVGEARMTEDGLKIPISGYGPGYDKFFNTYLWRMCVHEGSLYVGTFTTSALLPYLPRDKWTEVKKTVVDAELPFLMENMAGFDLWRTRDGVLWFPITRNGFGNEFNYGVRTMASTPYGLFVGCANPFGPDVNVKRAAGWQYEPNKRGGLEIWLGSHSRTGESADTGILTPAEDATKRMLPPVEAGGDTEEDRFVNSVIAEFYGGSAFRCLGYWGDKIVTAEDAAANLLEELLSFLPEKKGTVVILHDDLGGVAEYLKKDYPPTSIIVVCSGRAEREAVEARCPGVRVMNARAPRLRLGKDSIDAVINVETLSGNVRARDWIREIYRVLKTGGQFLGAEILSNSDHTPWVLGQGRKKQTVTHADAFGSVLEQAGFQVTCTVDATVPCWQACRRELNTFLHEKMIHNELDSDMVDSVKSAMFGTYMPITACVLAAGMKPKE